MSRSTVILGGAIGLLSVGLGAAVWYALHVRGTLREREADVAHGIKMDGIACKETEDQLLRSSARQLESLQYYREPPGDWTSGLGDTWTLVSSLRTLTCGQDSAMANQHAYVSQYLVPRGHYAYALRHVRLLAKTPLDKWSSIAVRWPKSPLAADQINVEKGKDFSSPFHVSAWNGADDGACALAPAQAPTGCTLRDDERRDDRRAVLAMLDSTVEFWRDAIVEKRDLLDAPPVNQQSAITAITRALSSLSIAIEPPASSGPGGVVDMARWAWDAPNKWANETADRIRSLTDDDLRALRDRLFDHGPDYEAFSDALDATAKGDRSRASN
jgi:hypothetical protein